MPTAQAHLHSQHLALSILLPVLPDYAGANGTSQLFWPFGNQCWAASKRLAIILGSAPISCSCCSTVSANHLCEAALVSRLKTEHAGLKAAIRSTRDVSLWGHAVPTAATVIPSFPPVMASHQGLDTHHVTRSLSQGCLSLIQNLIGCLTWVP